MTSDIHNELMWQIKGALNIDIGNYLFIKAGIDLYYEGDYELNIYINDRKYVIPDSCGFIDIDNIEIERKIHIGHYHADDLLWLLIHYESEKNKLLKRVNEYIEWKLKELKENK